MISHHPEPELLLDYASGAQREPLAVLIATHLALCHECRSIVAEHERIGGVLVGQLEPVSLSADALDKALARLDESGDVGTGPIALTRESPLDAAQPILPQPLRRYVGASPEGLPWRSLGSVSEAPLLSGFHGFRTRLMRIKGGARMPRHTHEGSELTLVLAGGFTDNGDHYLRGDVAEADPDVEHQPMADRGEDCLCLAVTDAPLRMTGAFGRLLNPLLRKWL